MTADDARPSDVQRPDLPPAAPRVLSGFKPTGRLTLGNLLGAVRPLVALQRRLAAAGPVTVFAMVADLHALTVDHDPALLRGRALDVAATLLACGLDDESVVLFRQSQVPQHTELAYLLECTARHGEMTRMTAFKEKAQSLGGAGGTRLSLLTYPALMAADVLLYRTDLVPVGDDQRQHLELTRRLARRVNAAAVAQGLAEVFTVPRAVVPEHAARVHDLRDPRTKMGKSGADLSGVLHVTDSPTRLAAAVRGAVTDLDPQLDYDPELRPGVANLAEILGALTDTTPAAALHGLRGSGRLKAAVTDALVQSLAPVRARHAELTGDPTGLAARLDDAARRAGDEAAVTLTAARTALGL